MVLLWIHFSFLILLDHFYKLADNNVALLCRSIISQSVITINTDLLGFFFFFFHFTNFNNAEFELDHARRKRARARFSKSQRVLPGSLMTIYMQWQITNKTTRCIYLLSSKIFFLILTLIVIPLKKCLSLWFCLPQKFLMMDRSDGSKRRHSHARKFRNTFGRDTKIFQTIQLQWKNFKTRRALRMSVKFYKKKKKTMPCWRDG